MNAPICDCVNCKKDSILNGLFTYNCECCNNPFNKESKFEIVNGKTGEALICTTCLTTHYVTCPDCAKYSNKTDLHDVVSLKTSDAGVHEFHNPKSVCSKCFVQNYKKCDCCDVKIHRNFLHIYKEKSYCWICFEKYYKKCAHCGEIFPQEKVTRSLRRSKKVVCENCFNAYGPIEQYSTRSSMKFFGNAPHFYGVELEVEIKDKLMNVRGLNAQRVIDLLGEDFVLTKEDGSVPYGFEIVTEPASLMEQKVRWNKFFDNLPETLLSYNTESCGLHVHCSKEPLTLLTIAKIVVFINNPYNKGFVETIAGRTANRFTSFSSKKHGVDFNHPKIEELRMTGEDNHYVSLNRGNPGINGSRYEAVNLCNKGTIEFRIFKGTLKRESFFKALEFCDAMIHFCKSCESSISFCKDKVNFINYVGLNSKTYPHLWAFICAKVLKKDSLSKKDIEYMNKFGFKPNSPSDK